MNKTALLTIFMMIGLSAGFASCATSGSEGTGAKNSITQSRDFTPFSSGDLAKGELALPDQTIFWQKDERWAEERLGNTPHDTLGKDGCLVTASAMALGNLGFDTNPSDLNTRLAAADSFTPRGWLIWDGIRKVTDNRAEARYYDTVGEEIIEQCISDGFYPLVQFFLPNGRSHWAMIVRKSARGFHMRDPLRISKKPLIFPRNTDAFKAVRCVGLKS